MALKFDHMTVSNLRVPGRYTDSATKGLQLLIKPSGTKYWLLRFTYENQQKELGLGSYPTITLKVAREMALETRVKINRGENPIETKKLIKTRRSRKKIIAPLFKEFALQCVESKRAEWRNVKHAEQWIYSLTHFAFPVIGNMHIDQIETSHILEILNPIWRTKTETASRLRGRLEWVLASASTQKLRSGMNPAIWKGHLQTALPIPSKIAPVKHHKAMPYKELTSFIGRLKEEDCMSALALEFTILNASRTGEVINGLRSEINEGIWTIPPERMKANKEHRVPLSQRSIELLEIAKIQDLNSRYLFSKNGKSLCNMAMSSLLKRMEVTVTIHGFRSTFRDWISEETDHSSEVAEKALAHAISNQVEAAYRRGDLLVRRRRLMDDWASYCTTGDYGNIIKLSELEAA